MAAEYFAASAIRDRFGDKDDVSLEFYNRAKEIIAQVSKNLEGGGYMWHDHSKRGVIKHIHLMVILHLINQCIHK